MTTRSKTVLLLSMCSTLLLLGACGDGSGDPTTSPPSLPTAGSSSAVAPSGSTSPRSWPARPTTVHVPKPTRDEWTRTVVSPHTTRVTFYDSTARARRRDAWVLRGACAVPAGELGPGRLTWTVGRGVPDTTDFDVVASGELVCGLPVRDVRLPELHDKPVQIKVSFPTDDITSAYLLVVPRR